MVTGDSCNSLTRTPSRGSDFSFHLARCGFPQRAISFLRWPGYGGPLPSFSASVHSRRFTGVFLEVRIPKELVSGGWVIAGSIQSSKLKVKGRIRTLEDRKGCGTQKHLRQLFCWPSLSCNPQLPDCRQHAQSLAFCFPQPSLRPAKELARLSVTGEVESPAKPLQRSELDSRSYYR